MDAERYRRVRSIFDEAIVREGAARDAWLDEACGGDATLRAEVESLLARDAAAGAFLTPPAASAEPGAPGAIVGRYRLRRPLGAGGMGTVWLAERAEDDFRQEVAIKLIKRGMDTEEILRRFRGERQVLARLAHPNVARLLDGGATADGTPYLVMERIDGTPIDQWCAEHDAPVARRLELFQTVCRAVHFAHRNLVVHRDIKPANILVTPAGEVKLLDFGIAKVLSGEAGGGPAATATNLRLLTPEYASPEQVRGEPISTASDVYALGVVLYELLTGRRPYDIEGHTPSAIERAVCETTPPRPSTVAPRAVARQIAGDLDMITGMAMRKEPDRRYVSAEQLAEDVDRHRRGLPVLARPDSIRYRSGRFVKRNRALVGLVGALFLVVSGSTVALAVQSSSVVRQRNDALVEAERAKATVTFLTRMLSSVDPIHARRRDVTVREVLEEASGMLDDALAQQPEVRQVVHATLGAAWQSIGYYDRATPHLRRALELARARHGDDHAAVADARAALVDVLLDRSDLDEAEALATANLALRERLGDTTSTAYARSLNDTARLALARGDFETAGALGARALALVPADDEARVRILLTLAAAREGATDLDACERLYREALAIQRERFGEDHPRVFEVLNALALHVFQKGRYAEADPMFEDATAIARRWLGDEHPLLAECLSNHAFLLEQLGRYDESEPLYRDALRIQRARLDPDNTELAANLNNLARLLFRVEQLDESEAFYREALAITRAQLGDEHRHVATCMNNLAALLRRRGDLAGAEAMSREAVEIQRRVLAPNDVSRAAGLNALALILNERGAFVDAAERFRESLGILLASVPDHPYVPTSMQNLARALQAVGEIDEAERLLRDALAKIEAGQGPDHPTTTSVMDNLSLALRDNGKLDEATALARDALERRRRTRPDSREVADSLNNLATILSAAGALDEAIEHQLESNDRYRALVGDRHRSVANGLRNLGVMLGRADRLDEAEAQLRAAFAMADETAPDHWIRAACAASLGACLSRRGAHDEAEPLLVEGHAALAAQLGPGHAKTRAARDDLAAHFEAIGDVERLEILRASAGDAG